MDNNNEIYNLPLASFTFGKENKKAPISKGNNNTFKNKGQIKPFQNNTDLYGSIKKKNIQLNNIDNNININNNEISPNNYFFANNSSQNNNDISAKEEMCELTFGGNNELIREENESNNINKNPINIQQKKNINNFVSLFFDKGGINESFISVILYSIHHMKLFRKFIINDLNSEKNKNFQNFQNSFLFHLREILLQIGKNKIIDIHQFRENLSKQFQNRRKFLADQPEDPSELLFVIINAIHSYSIQFPLNDISDEACTEKCFSHKFIWMDLARIDECKCKGKTKRLFSNHNYITDIPMKKIFNLMNNNVNIINKKENEGQFLLYESNQKLFNYYTNLISGIKTNCPTNGQRCPINKTFHKLHLANSPSYLIFNLEHEINKIEDNYAYSVMNILKSLILIPSKFDIWTLFELNSKKNKNDFEFIGCILFKISKVYSCAFKNKQGLMIYYKCDINENINLNDENNGNNNKTNIIEFISYFDFVVFCIKNGLIPIILFYQGSFLSHKNNRNKENFNTVNIFDDFLTNDQIIFFEKFCFYSDNLYKILQNKLRRKENLLSSKIKKNNISNLNLNKNNIIMDEYNCFNCQYKNKYMNKICVKCGFNNNDYFINTISNKNKMMGNNKYFNNIPKNINYSQGKHNLNYSYIIKNKNKNIVSQGIFGYNNHMIIQLSKRKKLCASPDIRVRDSNKILENYNFGTYQDKNGFTNFDLPIPYIPKKEKKITIITNLDKNKNENNLNKTEINIKNKNNNLFNKEIKFSKKMHTSPKTYKSNNLSINNNNDDLNSNHKKILSINNKNKISLDNSNNQNSSNIENKRMTKKYDKNNSSKKINLITRTLTSNKEIVNFNKFYLNSENNQIFIKNKIDNKKANLRKKQNNQMNRNKLYNNNFYNDKDIFGTEENDINKSKKKNFDLNNLYLNSINKNKKTSSINNLNYMNYSYNDIQMDRRRSAKQKKNENSENKNNNINYNKRTYNDKSKSKNSLKLNAWTCQNCSNMNSDEFLYCKVCKRNKDGELNRIKTPAYEKKNKNKIAQKIQNDFTINNENVQDKNENNKNLKKDYFNGFNSTKEFRKNKLHKNNIGNNNKFNSQKFNNN